MMITRSLLIKRSLGVFDGSMFVSERHQWRELVGDYNIALSDYRNTGLKATLDSPSIKFIRG